MSGLSQESIFGDLVVGKAHTLRQAIKKAVCDQKKNGK